MGKTQKYAQVISDCSKIIELDSMDELIPKSHRLRANAYLALKQYQNAINDFVLLLAHDPSLRNSGSALHDAIGLTESYEHMKNYKKAVRVRQSDCESHTWNGIACDARPPVC
jgi:tetratricopeptide (TPR) repeat protein